MSTQAIVQERSQLHNWIEGLPSTQFDLVYNFVGELVKDQQEKKVYLSNNHKQTISIQNDVNLLVEDVFEKGVVYSLFTPLNQEIAASQLQQLVDQQESLS